VPNTTISSSAVNSDFSDIATALTQSVSADGQTALTGVLKQTSGSAAAPSVTFQSDATTGFYLAAAGQIGISCSGVNVGTITSKGPVGIIPIGTVWDFAGSSVPAGWYLCYGQAISRTTYSALFAVIQTTYGSGDGVSTFNLPDCRGRTSFGVDNMGGSAANRLTSTYYGTAANVLGAGGGSQSTALTSTNQLPPYTPTGTVTGSISGTQTSPTLIIQVGGTFTAGNGAGWNLTTFNINGSSFTWSGSFTGDSVGASTPFANVPPGITFNKMIFAGA